MRSPYEAFGDERMSFIVDLVTTASPATAETRSCSAVENPSASNVARSPGSLSSGLPGSSFSGGALVDEVAVVERVEGHAGAGRCGEHAPVSIAAQSPIG